MHIHPTPLSTKSRQPPNTPYTAPYSPPHSPQTPPNTFPNSTFTSTTPFLTWVPSIHMYITHHIHFPHPLPPISTHPHTPHMPSPYTLHLLHARCIGAGALPAELLPLRRLLRARPAAFLLNIWHTSTPPCFQGSDPPHPPIHTPAVSVCGGAGGVHFIWGRTENSAKGVERPCTPSPRTTRALVALGKTRDRFFSLHPSPMVCT